MRKITTFVFAALLVMGFAATASAECGHLLRTAETPTAPGPVADGSDKVVVEPNSGG